MRQARCARRIRTPRLRGDHPIPITERLDVIVPRKRTEDDACLQAALVLAERGYAVHWLRPRSKAPVAKGWQTAPVADVMTLRQTYHPGVNVGVRCGRWSQPQPGYGLAVIDVDVRDAAVCDMALGALYTLCGDVSHVPTVRSGSGMGGRHLWYACERERLPEKAATVLAGADTFVPGTKQRLWQIELLSTGKNLVVPPSIHPETGAAYSWLTPLPNTLPLLPEAVHAAIAATRAPTTTPGRTVHIRAHGVPRVRRVHGYRPGDDFNRRAAWHPILEPYGWVPVRHQGEVTYWRRPSKDAGISATTNYESTGLLYVFSTNAPPFEADTAYTPFAAYALLAHHGDFVRAAQILQTQGYGIQYLHGLRTIHAWPVALRTIAPEEVKPWL